MRPVFRFAALACTLAVMLSALIFVGTSTPALADVLKAAAKHKLVKYKITQTTEDRDNGTGDLVSVAYADLRAPRFRSEAAFKTLNRTVESAHFSVIDGAKNESLAVLTETVVDGALNDETPDFLKEILTSGKFPRKEARLGPAYGDFTPATDAAGKSLLENLRNLEQHKDIVAVKDERDGRELLKYLLEDENTTTTLWVDKKTELPVRMEREIIDHTPNIPRNHWALTDFEWDPELKDVKSVDELFNTTPPKGYQVTDDRPKKAE